MSATSTTDATACEATLRQLLAAGLSLDLLADVLDVPPAVVDAMQDGAYPLLDPEQRERLALFAAILVRVEIRCGHDPHVASRLLATPLPALDDRTPADAMRGGLDALRLVHRVAGEVALPEQRWWRAAPRR